MSDYENENEMSEDEEMIPASSICRKLVDELDTPVKRASEAHITADPANDHMKVFLRIRPFTQNERDKGECQVKSEVYLSLQGIN